MHDEQQDVLSVEALHEWLDAEHVNTLNGELDTGQLHALDAHD